MKQTKYFNGKIFQTKLKNKNHVFYLKGIYKTRIKNVLRVKKYELKES